MSAKDRRIVGGDLKDVEFGWPNCMPLCRPLGNGLWEVRSQVTGGRIARLIFCMTDDRIVVLHAFFKKTQKTPKNALDIALKRKKEIEN